MSKKILNPWLVAGAALLLWVGANLLAAHLNSDCGLPAVLGRGGCADDIRRAGFPLQFFEQGGFIARHYWSWGALLADALIAVITCALAGWFAARRAARR